MISWREELYVGEEAREFREEIVNNIKEHKLQGGVYVIILAVNGKDIFDIIPSVMLSEDGYKGRDIKILGIAKGLIEAKELGSKMIMDVYEQTGGFEVRGFFS